ncbi:MAG TPA: DJ-1/PfpI family protein [Candidatus Binatia bacterium]|nr:DJ-1/PfpI family protein [Candidatus Binatia bacterium]
MHFAIVVFQGVEELDIVGPWEVLRYATGLIPDERHRVSMLTLTPTDEITAQLGMHFRPDGVLDAPVDVLIIPGGGYVTRAPQGVRAEIEHGELPRRAAELHRGGTTLAGVCTGVMVIGSLGMLKGRPAITHHGALDELRASGAQLIEARVVDDGDIITCGGVSSGIDLGLWLVERFLSKELAEKTAHYIHYNRGEVYVSKRLRAV